MVNRLGKCSLCPFSVTKNGEWVLDSAMREHVSNEHRKEYEEWERRMESINRQIIELKHKRTRLYTSTW